MHRSTCVAAAFGLALLGGAMADRASAQGGCEVTGPAANVVCSNPSLAGLAGDLATAFRALVQAAPREARPGLFREQRDWSLGLERCLGGQGAEQCIETAYEERINIIGGQAEGTSPSFAGQVPVEQGTLPPPEGGAPESAADVAPGGSTGAPDTAAPEAAVAAVEPVPEPAPAAEAESDPEDGGGFRSAATGGEATAPAGGSDTPSILTATVWKAEIASGIRPGTIFVFQGDGALVTADCVEAYRLGTWDLAEDGSLRLNEGGGTEQSAKIVSIQDRFVRLEMSGADGASQTLVLRPALAPFSCKAG